MRPVGLLQLNNRGAVLIVGLFTLALLSLLGAAATTTSRTDISINGNMKTIQESFYAAEVGIAMGELAISRMGGHADLDTQEVGHYDENEHPHWKYMDWNSSDSNTVSTLDLPNGFDHLAEHPRYTTEEEGFRRDSVGLGDTPLPTGFHVFNVYAKGTGGSRKTQTILQTTFETRFK